MEKARVKKIIGMIVDALMYIILLLQMAYVFTGNTAHELLGIGFFVCLIIHMILKRLWFKNVAKRKVKLLSARRFADLMIVLLMICLILLMLSSMGVSRMLFPNIHFLGSPTFHRTLATLAIAFAVIHGGMHAYFKSKNKKKTAVFIAIGAIAALALGFYGVPYLNRHLRIVEVSATDTAENSDRTETAYTDDNALVVYFTRVGNTDFEADVDAVSGASLLLQDGVLTGNTQFMSEALKSILGCEAVPITITEYKYPSSYAETCDVGGKEIKENARPKIEAIDVTDYDSIYLVYPIWWGTIPMPVATFLEENDFAEKTIYLVATQGSSGFVSSTKAIKELVPNAEVIETISIYCDDIPKSKELLLDWFENK